MRLVHKVLNVSLDEVNEEERSFWAVASTEGPDRQGDLIASQGWDLANYLKNPVIPWAHDYGRPPVAKALAVKVEEGKLLFQAQFPPREDYPFADTVYRLYKGGYLRAFSVGFTPTESQMATTKVAGREVTGTHYLKQELFEISCVTLPANPEAVVAAGLPAPSVNPTPAGPPLPASRAAAAPASPGQALDRLIAGRLAYHLGLARA